MECEHCEEELTWEDYYGMGIPGRENFEKIGDIYRCDNEDCDGHLYYTDRSGDLHEGYPC